MILESSSSALKGCCVNPAEATLSKWGGSGFGARAGGIKSSTSAESALRLTTVGGVDSSLDSSQCTMLCSQSPFLSPFTKK